MSISKKTLKRGDRVAYDRDECGDFKILVFLRKRDSDEENYPFMFCEDEHYDEKLLYTDEELRTIRPNGNDPFWGFEEDELDEDKLKRIRPKTKRHRKLAKKKAKSTRRTARRTVARRPSDAAALQSRRVSSVLRRLDNEGYF